MHSQNNPPSMKPTETTAKDVELKQGGSTTMQVNNLLSSQSQPKLMVQPVSEQKNAETTTPVVTSHLLHTGSYHNRFKNWALEPPRDDQYLASPTKPTAPTRHIDMDDDSPYLYSTRR
jgi:hypothetical protein